MIRKLNILILSFSAAIPLLPWMRPKLRPSRRSRW
ncbi:hypothetical protein Y695_00359 [Hydrogenophaga sp. T4]|nr:hypothetical protein Y695_00359 [Hydrogenophaga sp. T4]